MPLSITLSQNPLTPYKNTSYITNRLSFSGNLISIMNTEKQGIVYIPDLISKTEMLHQIAPSAVAISTPDSYPAGMRPAISSPESGKVMLSETSLRITGHSLSSSGTSIPHKSQSDDTHRKYPYTSYLQPYEAYQSQDNQHSHMKDREPSHINSSRSMKQLSEMHSFSVEREIMYRAYIENDHRTTAACEKPLTYGD